MGGTSDDAQVALDELAELLAASRRVVGLLDTAVLAQRVAREARQLVGTEIATLAILEDPGLLVMRGTAGTRTSAIEQLHIPRGTGVGGRILVERRPIAIDDYAHDESITRDHVDAVTSAEGIQGVAGVPIEHDDRLLGILYGGVRTVGSVGDRGKSLLVEFAKSVGPALNAARRAEQAQRLAAQAERQRMAYELHDTLGQLLFGIGLAARRAQGDPETSHAVLTSLQEIETGASRAASQLREALRGLVQSAPEEGLATAMRMDTDAFTTRCGIAATLLVVGEPVGLKSRVASLLLAIVREGLHNIEKYARASSVIVTLYYSASGVGVVLQDDGMGLPVGFGIEPLPRGGGHLGLASLLQRAQQLGGTLVVIPNEDGGATLRANIPRGGALV